MKKTLSLLLLLFMAATLTFAQQAPQEKLFTPEQMRQDLDSMYRWVNATHPNLYLRIKKEKADKEWEKVKKQLKTPLTAREFSIVASPLLSQYWDGHTSLGFDLEDKGLQEYHENGGKFFPLGMEVRDQELIVKKATDASGVKPGAKITKVNGVKTGALLKKMLFVWSADNQKNQAANMGRLFGITLWGAYGWGDKVEVEYQNYGDSRKQKEVLNGISYSDLWKLMSAGSRSYKLTIHEKESLAVLELFSLNRTKALEVFLDSAFTAIKEKNIQHLAIDMRRSGGGNSVVGDMVLQYTTTKPYKQGDAKITRYSTVLAAMPYNKGLKSTMDRISQKEGFDGNVYRSEWDAVAPEPLAKPELLFEGKLYMLTAPRTFSSSHMMASAFKAYKLGTMIGEATGGSMQFFGEPASFQLPNTKLWGICAVAEWLSAGFTEASADKGVQPDVELKQSIKDLAEGRDTVMEYLKESIRTGKLAAAK
ncbi:S41 family peptidase [Pontibacter cellulosilyticus]|uniref:Tail specific protease domain-containing protein n=1 Tax=Pontibacter cellulosilyticus TaxID=1720253 RepID=A0A923SKK6_9BACT|nr:S41 family peptidase [Pontibacter cellulosilyticus]MBC5994973.1 hypothetical protein [Pontibacter cellulosilyticus]